MANDTIPTLQWLSKQIEKLDKALLRQMMKLIAELMMGLDADQRFGAAFGQKSDQRVNHRNGYRQRRSLDSLKIVHGQEPDAIIRQEKIAA
jgi:transposase-like protein